MDGERIVKKGSFPALLILLVLAGSSYATGKTLYFPHYGDGDGLSMILVVNNLSGSRAEGVLTAFSSAGQPQILPFSSGNASEVDLSIPANGSKILLTKGTSDPLKSGYITVELDQNMFSGVAIFKFADGSEASVLPVQLSRQFAIFVESSDSFDTGFAVARLTTSDSMNRPGIPGDSIS